jgi:hypothetical protein
LGDRAVEVRVEPSRSGSTPSVRDRRARIPQELFAQYCAERGIEGRRVQALFDELLDAELTGGST